MEPVEIKTRLIEAAAKFPTPDAQHGYAAGVIVTAGMWYSWVMHDDTHKAGDARKTLGLPLKK